MQLEGERAAVGKRENGAAFQMGRAVALRPWTFNARGATVLDEEVAGLQMDVEWTEGVEERVWELLERSTLK